MASSQLMSAGPHSPAAATCLLLAVHTVPAPRLCCLWAGAQPSLPQVSNAGGVAQHCTQRRGNGTAERRG